MELFFCSRIETDNFFLDEEESHHLFKVMRKAVGDELMVTDGKGKLTRAKITLELKKRCALQLIEVVKEEPPLFPTIHIAISPTKSIDRFEWFLEKSTEIGVTEITPVICQRSERKKLKPERLQKILIGAMKQSLRLWLPKLNPPISLNSFLTHDSQLPPLSFICHCQSPNLPSLQSLYPGNEAVLLMIGPEGDFTTEEILFAEKSGFSAVSLGKNRLRTETAGIVAVHTIQVFNG